MLNENENAKLLVLTSEAIKQIQVAIDFAKDNNLLNTQQFLDFLDHINELSVLY